MISFNHILINHVFEPKQIKRCEQICKCTSQTDLLDLLCPLTSLPRCMTPQSVVDARIKINDSDSMIVQIIHTNIKRIVKVDAIPLISNQFFSWNREVTTRAQNEGSIFQIFHINPFPPFFIQLINFETLHNRVLIVVSSSNIVPSQVFAFVVSINNIKIPTRFNQMFLVSKTTQKRWKLYQLQRRNINPWNSSPFICNIKLTLEHNNIIIVEIVFIDKFPFLITMFYESYYTFLKDTTRNTILNTTPRRVRIEHNFLHRIWKTRNLFNFIWFALLNDPIIQHVPYHQGCVVTAKRVW